MSSIYLVEHTQAHYGAAVEAYYKQQRRVRCSQKFFSVPGHQAEQAQINDVVTAIRRAAKAVGEDLTRFGSHALRSGGTTALFNTGVDSLAVKQFGRWKSDAAERYTVIKDDLTTSLAQKLDKAAAVHPSIGNEQDSEATADLLPSNGAVSPRRSTVRTFQYLVGSLLWISRCTRSDISFAVHRVTRNAHAPNEGDWRLAKRIAKYLKGAQYLKFLMNTTQNAIGNYGISVEAFSDADYASNKQDRKSVTGGVLMVAGVVVAWLCKKQACAALSTMKSEFVVASQSTAEMLGIVECLKEIGVKIHEPLPLHVDNQAAIAQLEGEDTSGRAKDIDTRHKFVKDFVKKGGVNCEVLRVQENACRHPDKAPSSATTEGAA